MQPIGELDQHHAHIFGHGQQHLAQALRPHGFLAAIAQPFLIIADDPHFGDAINQMGHAGTAGLGNLIQGEVTVLHRVVENRRTQALVVEVKSGEDVGDCDDVSQIGLPRRPNLLLVRLSGQPHRRADDLQLLAGVAVPDTGNPRFRIGAGIAFLNLAFDVDHRFWQLRATGPSV